MVFENEPVNEDFEGFCVTKENNISNIITYAKSLYAESVNKLEEADTEEMLNTDNDASVVHSLSDGEIAEMVLNTDKHDDDDNDTVNTGENNPHTQCGVNV
jgi:hypothetical protein